MGVGPALVAMAACLGTTGTGLSQDASPAKKLNKFTGNAEAIKEGRALYLKYGCSGCHGVGGGGGMGPPLIDDVWKFGSSDEAVYKVIKGQTQTTMPNVFGQQMTDDEIWKMVAYIRSVYAGDKSKISW
jgi:cytochrome c(L)